MICEAIPHSINPTRAERLQLRLAQAKRAFTTRHVDLATAERLVRSGRVPVAGDVVLARVTAIGQHARIENIHGRRGQLYVGDEIIVAYGNRYAPDQFEAFVPTDLEECDLVAGGGVASRMTRKHAGMKNPTKIEVIGLLAGESGQTINLKDFAVQADAQPLRPTRVIAVVGSSMNAGKTTTAGGLVHGLTRAGFRVGAAKITGTGSGGDLWTMRDAGAIEAIDFTDAGHASTFCVDSDGLADICTGLLDKLARSGADIAVVEIADGLLQPETAALVEMAQAQGWFDGFVFAAADAMGSAFGANWLAQRGIVPLALSGLVSASPLAAGEAARTCALPVATLAELRDPVAVTKIVFRQDMLVEAAA
ncbi:DUF1611 domain-containing protein [Novosphingobium sp.]|uniref:DUF1611 domain-containing protein n=1 Tax=Novosphingobium sp. TaxID=1874826 RepID=UPI002609B9C6|nr:DUF1611 domain-containing protein [Novosphingobium sp.]